LRKPFQDFSPHNGLQTQPTGWSPNQCSFKGLWRASNSSVHSQLRNRVLSNETIGHLKKQNKKQKKQSWLKSI